MIRPATPADAAAIIAIYNPYILDTTVTFEELALTAAQMAERIAQIQQDGLPWLVWLEQGDIIGYAYASKWRVRSAYRFSVESTVYVKPGFVGCGFGRRLYQALLDELTALGFHLVISGITLPNDPSIALHEKMGFVQCGHFKQVGFKFGQWRDVGYWQKILVPTEVRL